jgi:hypothetical protein
LAEPNFSRYTDHLGWCCRDGLGQCATHSIAGPGEYQLIFQALYWYRICAINGIILRSTEYALEDRYSLAEQSWCSDCSPLSVTSQPSQRISAARTHCNRHHAEATEERTIMPSICSSNRELLTACSGSWKRPPSAQQARFLRTENGHEGKGVYDDRLRLHGRRRYYCSLDRVQSKAHLSI